MKIDDLANAIMSTLQEYDADVVKATIKSVDEVAKEANKEIKAHCTFKGSGEYIKNFAVRKWDTRTGAERIWHVKSPHHRLTYLLEKGHAKRGGGRTRSFQHIRYGDEYAQKELPKRIKRKIEAIK